jgi:hypothetical protein
MVDCGIEQLRFTARDANHPANGDVYAVNEASALANHRGDGSSRLVGAGGAQGAGRQLLAFPQRMLSQRCPHRRHGRGPAEKRSGAG